MAFLALQPSDVNGKKVANMRLLRSNRGALRAENLVNFLAELEIQVTDALDTVGVQVDDHFVPDIEPFRVMVHGLRDQRNTRHIPEGADEVLAFECAMQLPLREGPTLKLLEAFLNFHIG